MSATGNIDYAAPLNNAIYALCDGRAKVVAG